MIMYGADISQAFPMIEMVQLKLEWTLGWGDLNDMKKILTSTNICQVSQI